MQVAAAHHLQEVTRKTVEGRAKLGVTAFAEALLGIPKILAENSGYDAQASASQLPHSYLSSNLASCLQPVLWCCMQQLCGICRVHVWRLSAQLGRSLPAAEPWSPLGTSPFRQDACTPHGSSHMRHGLMAINRLSQPPPAYTTVCVAAL